MYSANQLLAKLSLDNTYAHGRILAIDFGTSRIGYAMTNLNRSFASPLVTISNSSIAYAKNILMPLIKDENVLCVIIGVSDNEKMRVKAIHYGSNIARSLGLPYGCYDESFSSTDAISEVRQLWSKKKIHNDLDKIAACKILDNLIRECIK